MACFSKGVRKLAHATDSGNSLKLEEGFRRQKSKRIHYGVAVEGTGNLVRPGPWFEGAVMDSALSICRLVRLSLHSDPFLQTMHEDAGVDALEHRGALLYNKAANQPSRCTRCWSASVTSSDTG